MNQPANKTTRRTFIKTAATIAGAGIGGGLIGCGQPREKIQPVEAAGPSAAQVEGMSARPVNAPAPLPAFHRGEYAPKLDKLRVAYIGTAGIGHYHLDKTTELECVECPCYCDVDTQRMARAAELFPNARPYQDYRRMLEVERDNIDAVMIGTPDHHHYPATMLAMRMGKHVYTQKPLAHTVWEARQLTEAARRYKLATQMGNQGHALEGWRLVYEWVHSGAIGDVIETHTWTDRPIWPQGMSRPKEEEPVPESLDWDCWLGPAPLRPFKGPAPEQNAGPYHPFNWRGWWDFGCGALGDMACHTMDGIFAVLDPGSPAWVEPIAATPITDEAFPTCSMLRWYFPATASRPAFISYWYDGGLKPRCPEALELERRLPDTGNLFLGTKGALLITGDYLDSPRIIPETLMRQIGKPPQMLERSPGHVKEWVMAAMGQAPLDFPKSNFAYAGPFTEAVLLGNVALRTGRRIEWDAANLRVPNLPEANQYISKTYREGWRV